MRCQGLKTIYGQVLKTSVQCVSLYQWRGVQCGEISWNYYPWPCKKVGADEGKAVLVLGAEGARGRARCGQDFLHIDGGGWWGDWLKWNIGGWKSFKGFIVQQHAILTLWISMVIIFCLKCLSGILEYERSIFQVSLCSWLAGEQMSQKLEEEEEEEGEQD